MRTIEDLIDLDLDFYRRSNVDLATFTDEQLIAHYFEHGYREGRASSAIAVRGPFVEQFIGEVTPERVALLQDADAIVREEIHRAGLEREIWQAFAVLADIRSVGVMGDERTYGHPIIIRAVTSEDAMTADWARLPYDLLDTMSSRIINEVKGINRVVYDVTSKPPGTIEWE